ncbi:MAG: DUF3343 domain-containing protein [Clostridiales bacterium]|jgi:hypothetical protein|nr:DUF3343 domain-containing protein [Clostridiales bacterium]
MNVYFLAVFRTRDHTMRFNAELLRGGFGTSVVNTPRELQSGCGISVKFQERALNYAKRALRYYDYSSFAGFFCRCADGYKRV